MLYFGGITGLNLWLKRFQQVKWLNSPFLCITLPFSLLTFPVLIHSYLLLSKHRMLLLASLQSHFLILNRLVNRINLRGHIFIFLLKHLAARFGHLNLRFDLFGLISGSVAIMQRVRLKQSQLRIRVMVEQPKLLELLAGLLELIQHLLFSWLLFIPEFNLLLVFCLFC